MKSLQLMQMHFFFACLHITLVFHFLTYMSMDNQAGNYSQNNEAKWKRTDLLGENPPAAESEDLSVQWVLASALWTSCGG